MLQYRRDRENPNRVPVYFLNFFHAHIVTTNEEMIHDFIIFQNLVKIVF